LIVVRALWEKVGSQLSFSWYHPPKQGDWRGSFSVLFLYAKLQKNGGLCKENGVFNLRGRPVFSGLARGDAEAVLLDAEVMLLDAEVMLLHAEVMLLRFRVKRAELAAGFLTFLNINLITDYSITVS